MLVSGPSITQKNLCATARTRRGVRAGTRSTSRRARSRAGREVECLPQRDLPPSRPSRNQDDSGRSGAAGRPQSSDFRPQILANLVKLCRVGPQTPSLSARIALGCLPRAPQRAEREGASSGCARSDTGFFRTVVEAPDLGALSDMRTGGSDRPGPPIETEAVRLRPSAPVRRRLARLEPLSWHDNRYLRWNEALSWHDDASGQAKEAPSRHDNGSGSVNQVPSSHDNASGQRKVALSWHDNGSGRARGPRARRDRASCPPNPLLAGDPSACRGKLSTPTGRGLGQGAVGQAPDLALSNCPGGNLVQTSLRLLLDLVRAE